MVFYVSRMFYLRLIGLDVRDGVLPEVPLLYEIALAILYCLFVCLFVYTYPCVPECCSFKVCEELCWDFDGDCSESIDYFWYDYHFYYFDSTDPRAPRTVLILS